MRMPPKLQPRLQQVRAPPRNKRFIPQLSISSNLALLSHAQILSEIQSCVLWKTPGRYGLSISLCGQLTSSSHVYSDILHMVELVILATIKTQLQIFGVFVDRQVLLVSIDSYLRTSLITEPWRSTSLRFNNHPGTILHHRGHTWNCRTLTFEESDF